MRKQLKRSEVWDRFTQYPETWSPEKRAQELRQGQREGHLSIVVDKHVKKSSGGVEKNLTLLYDPAWISYERAVEVALTAAKANRCSTISVERLPSEELLKRPPMPAVTSLIKHHVA